MTLGASVNGTRERGPLGEGLRCDTGRAFARRFGRDRPDARSRDLRAALAGCLVLGQRLTVAETLAAALVVAASVGAALTPQPHPTYQKTAP